VRRFLVIPAISVGSAVWAIGAFAIVPLFTILSGVFFWTLATFGFLAFRTFRRRRSRRGEDDDEAGGAAPAETPPAREDSVRSRVESLS
jgi:membrane protein implicated in regulation of membrane protease activity